MTRLPIVKTQERPVAASDLLQEARAERRYKQRFDLDLAIRFRTTDASGVAGDGRIQNMSSCGVLVNGGQGLKVGSVVELRIEWPCRLDLRVPLQVVAVARVVRCESSLFAAVFSGHEFRTAPANAV